ncbi:hypothetical protein OKW45_005708 [Paraburkholderia sp. WSM4175]
MPCAHFIRASYRSVRCSGCTIARRVKLTLELEFNERSRPDDKSRVETFPRLLKDTGFGDKPDKSHQHEFHGVVALKAIFGTDRTEMNAIFRSGATMCGTLRRSRDTTPALTIPRAPSTAFIFNRTTSWRAPKLGTTSSWDPTVRGSPTSSSSQAELKAIRLGSIADSLFERPRRRFLIRLVCLYRDTKAQKDMTTAQSFVTEVETKA